MRATRSPQVVCGTYHAGERLAWAFVRNCARIARSVALTALMAVAHVIAAAAILPGTAAAKDPSTVTQKYSGFSNTIDGGAATSPSAFPAKNGNPFGKIKPPDKTQPLNLQGDQLIYDTNSNSVIARGNVEIYYSNYILTADEVIYDRGAQTLTAAGNVVLKEPNGNIVRADRYTLTDDFRDGFVQSLSVVASDDTRISADRATRREGNVTEFVNGKFTPCKSEGGMPPLWCISAGRIIHDKEAQTITYQDAQFNLFGQPIAYVPYFQHADPTVKRKSGFLPPSIGTSSNSLGFYTEVPYYFALNPSYDFLFHPMYTAKQGVLWQGEWRHRLAKGMYTVKFAAIDQDWNDLPSDPDPNLDGWRGSIETHGKFSLGSWWNLGWDVTLESDDTFRRFYKLDSVLLTDRINDVYLEGLSNRNYMGIRLYQFGGLTFQDSDTAESLVHPLVDYNYVLSDPVLGGELKWNTNALSFSRQGDFSGVDVDQTLTRAVTELKWRREMTDAIGITYTPFAQIRGDAYSYSGYNQNTTTVDESTSFVRGLAAGGATVSYPWIAHSQAGSHVIEPIGQVVVRQAHVQQNQLPVEDARSLIFDDTTLFEVDKFSGYDRVETGTRANVGVQYTFTHNNGGYARFLAGQSFHLAGDNPFKEPGIDFDGNNNYNPYSGLDTDRSDYVLGAYLAPSSIFRFITQARFDEHDFAVRRTDVAGQLNFGPLLAQATYTFSAIDPQQTDDDQQDISAAVGLQLTDNWSVMATMRYDIDDTRRLLDTFRIKYTDECFVLTATYQESFIKDIERGLEPDRTVMLHFQFKHLGSYNYKTDTLDFVFGDQQNELK
ncbi:MAG: LPS-assembly protein LptD [Hyphomicrobiaceae bacterium]|nr:LPS-assembly protein LptD [Hyphomicrobiaceae bacterium]MCC0009895.1 LPS-assembly protein LptD [Hyphomicrobiaceae bacterium]